MARDAFLHKNDRLSVLFDRPSAEPILLLYVDLFDATLYNLIGCIPVCICGLGA